MVIPYEAPQGRRVNVVGAVTPYDPTGPRLHFATRRKADGPYDAAAHLTFVRQLTGLPPDPIRTDRRDRPGVVVLDNYAVHHAAAVKTAIPQLADQGVTFCSLPPYSPELNQIEPIWRQVKYQGLPERSHPTDPALQTAVEAALTAYAHGLAPSTNNLPRSA